MRRRPSAAGSEHSSESNLWSATERGGEYTLQLAAEVLRHADAAGLRDHGSMSLTHVLRSYGAILRARGMAPSTDTQCYRYLLRLSLDDVVVDWFGQLARDMAALHAQSAPPTEPAAVPLPFASTDRRLDFSAQLSAASSPAQWTPASVPGAWGEFELPSRSRMSPRGRGGASPRSELEVWRGALEHWAWRLQRRHLHAWRAAHFRVLFARRTLDAALGHWARHWTRLCFGRWVRRVLQRTIDFPAFSSTFQIGSALALSSAGHLTPMDLATAEPSSPIHATSRRRLWAARSVVQRSALSRLFDAWAAASLHGRENMYVALLHQKRCMWVRWQRWQTRARSERLMLQAEATQAAQETRLRREQATAKAEDAAYIYEQTVLSRALWSWYGHARRQAEYRYIVWKAHKTSLLRIGRSVLVAWGDLARARLATAHVKLFKASLLRKLRVLRAWHVYAKEEAVLGQLISEIRSEHFDELMGKCFFAWVNWAVRRIGARHAGAELAHRRLYGRKSLSFAIWRERHSSKVQRREQVQLQMLITLRHYDEELCRAMLVSWSQFVIDAKRLRAAVERVMVLTDTGLLKRYLFAWRAQAGIQSWFSEVVGISSARREARLRRSAFYALYMVRFVDELRSRCQHSQQGRVLALCWEVWCKFTGGALERKWRANKMMMRWMNLWLGDAFQGWRRYTEYRRGRRQLYTRAACIVLREPFAAWLQYAVTIAERREEMLAMYTTLRRDPLHRPIADVARKLVSSQVLRRRGELAAIFGDRLLCRDCLHLWCMFVVARRMQTAKQHRALTMWKKLEQDQLRACLHGLWYEVVITTHSKRKAFAAWRSKVTFWKVGDGKHCAAEAHRARVWGCCVLRAWKLMSTKLRRLDDTAWEVNQRVEARLKAEYLVSWAQKYRQDLIMLRVAMHRFTKRWVRYTKWRQKHAVDKQLATLFRGLALWRINIRDNARVLEYNERASAHALQSAQEKAMGSWCDRHDGWVQKHINLDRAEEFELRKRFVSWRAVTDELHRQHVVMRKFARAWLMKSIGKTLWAWKQYHNTIQAGKRTRAMLAYNQVDRCWGQWKVQLFVAVRKCRAEWDVLREWEEMVLLQRRLRGLVHNWLMMHKRAAFEDWYNRTQKQKQARALEKRIAVRQLKDLWLIWLAEFTARYFTRRRAFAAIHEISQDLAVRNERVRELCAKLYLFTGIQMAVACFRALVDYVALQKTVHRAAHKIQAAYNLRVFNAWHDLISEKLHNREIMQKIVERMRNMAKASCFDRWYQYTETSRNIKRHALRTLQSGIESRFARWVHYTDDTITLREIGKQVAANHVRFTLSAAISMWLAYNNFTRLMAKFINMQRSLEAGACFRRWHRYVEGRLAIKQEVKERRDLLCRMPVLRSECLACVFRWQHPDVVTRFEHWVGVVALLKMHKAAVAIGLQKLMGANMGACFTNWRAFAEQQSEIRAFVGRMAAAWARSLLMAWHEVAIELAATRIVMRAAVAHFYRNFVRSVLGAWVLWAAVEKAHRAIYYELLQRRAAYMVTSTFALWRIWAIERIDLRISTLVAARHWAIATAKGVMKEWHAAAQKKVESRLWLVRQMRRMESFHLQQAFVAWSVTANRRVTLRALARDYWRWRMFEKFFDHWKIYRAEQQHLRLQLHFGLWREGLQIIAWHDDCLSRSEGRHKHWLAADAFQRTKKLTRAQVFYKRRSLKSAFRVWMLVVVSEQRFRNHFLQVVGFRPWKRKTQARANRLQILTDILVVDAQAPPAPWWRLLGQNPCWGMGASDQQAIVSKLQLIKSGSGMGAFSIEESAALVASFVDNQTAEVKADFLYLRVSYWFTLASLRRWRNSTAQSIRDSKAYAARVFFAWRKYVDVMLVARRVHYVVATRHAMVAWHAWRRLATACAAINHGVKHRAFSVWKLHAGRAQLYAGSWAAELLKEYKVLQRLRQRSVREVCACFRAWSRRAALERVAGDASYNLQVMRRAQRSLVHWRKVCTVQSHLRKQQASATRLFERGLLRTTFDHLCQFHWRNGCVSAKLHASESTKVSHWRHHDERLLLHATVFHECRLLSLFYTSWATSCGEELGLRAKGNMRGRAAAGTVRRTLQRRVLHAWRVEVTLRRFLASHWRHGRIHRDLCFRRLTSWREYVRHQKFSRMTSRNISVARADRAVYLCFCKWRVGTRAARWRSYGHGGDVKQRHHSQFVQTLAVARLMPSHAALAGRHD